VDPLVLDALGRGDKMPKQTEASLPERHLERRSDSSEHHAAIVQPEVVD
jgi:hypothetical protein